MYTGMAKKASLRSTLAIHGSFFIILKTSSRDSILKCLYSTNSFKYFKFKMVSNVPFFFSFVETVEIKSSCPFWHLVKNPFLRRLLTSKFMMDFACTLWGIFGTLTSWGLFLKAILRLYFTIARINLSFVMFF